MRKTKHFIVMLLCALLSAPATLAQNPQGNGQADNGVSQDVLIIIQQQQVRFTARSAVEWMQLQVFNQSGEAVFDSSPVAASEINWPFQNANGESIKSGLYAYTLSIKESGAETARVRRGHFIVDRATDRETNVDRLWITSQGEKGIGTELTVARSEEDTVAGAVIAYGRTIGEGRDEVKSGGERTVQANNDKTNNQEALKASTAAAAGTAGQIAKYISATELGNSVMTEQNGNIGIGTTPSHPLHVGGNMGIRQNRLYFSGGDAWSSLSYNAHHNATNSNWVFPDPNRPAVTLEMDDADGVPRFSVYSTTSSNKTSWVQHFGINGNTGQIFINGNVGIGTANPGSKLEIVGQDALRLAGFQPFLTLVDTNGGRASRIQSGNGWLSLQVGDSNYNLQERLKIDIAGNVGLGMTAPAVSGLHIGAGVQGGQARLRLDNANGQFGGLNRWTNRLELMSTNAIGLSAGDVARPHFWLETNGNIGIGTPAPQTRLHVIGDRLRLENAGKVLDLRADGSALDLQALSHSLFISSLGPNGDNKVIINPFPESGNVGIGTAAPEAKLHVVGTTMTSALQITGGADFAENFEVNIETAGGEAMVAKIEPGMVVSIDPASPGKLTPSTRAYDRRVAGVISGAGGVKPGMIMSQEGTLADGKHPVALSGRAYCWVDASNGSIEPGDLLTTSGTPGHAMKVADANKAQGAIIGKAMTGLKEGKGLVLVLVTLQ